MATLLDLLPWIFSFVSYMCLVAITMYEIISLSDLENDYINTRQLGKRMNWHQVPQMVLHSVVTLTFLLFGRWLFFLLNAPFVAYNAQQYVKKQYLIDETEVFKEMKSLQRWRLAKLIFLLSMVILLMFRLILAAFE